MDGRDRSIGEENPHAHAPIARGRHRVRDETAPGGGGGVEFRQRPELEGRVDGGAGLRGDRLDGERAGGAHVETAGGQVGRQHVPRIR